MIERLLPSTVACHAARHDQADASLFPAEAALIEGAVDVRRQEFATARWCARRALARLGLPATPILRGPKHEPVWPSGVVGSITHCRGYRAAAVGRTTEVLTIGIDVEIDAPMPQGVERRALRDEERAWLENAPGGVNWGRVIFSAKESVYKAWFPMTGLSLWFDDAIVTIDPGEGRFQARLLVDAPPELAELDGRFLVEDGLVLTAIAVPV